MTITAIPTRYAGFRFRSRLEARWAVFFNELGITWQYEPQGYLVGEEQIPYLPDFWLPELGMWVEVKGSATDRDLVVLTAAALPISKGGLPSLDSDQPPNLIVLSNVPTSDYAIPLHPALHWDEKGVLIDLMYWFKAPDAPARGYAFRPPFARYARPRNLTYSGLLDAGYSFPSVLAAYRAARGARFEHGESGASS